MKRSLSTAASTAALLLVLTAAPPALAEEKPETLLDGLNNPCGIAVHPESGEIYIADSGAGRVIKIKDGKAVPVITDFPMDVYGKGPKYDIGPLGLLFFDKDTLVVGGGGLEDGKELLRIYKLPADGKPIKADKMAASFKLEPTEDIKGEGNFYALALTKGKDAIFVTSNGDDTKGWVAKLTINGTKFTKYERSIATKEATQVDAPVGITVHPKQGYLVVGQMGEINKPKDSLLTFYNPKDGKMLLNLETGLFDISAVLYSPKGHLYALDFAWMDAKEAGLFRLDKNAEDKTMTKTVKIVGLDKPTAMAFGKDGALYITVIGTAGEGDDKKPGKLLKLKPGL